MDVNDNCEYGPLYNKEAILKIMLLMEHWDILYQQVYLSKFALWAVCEQYKARNTRVTNKEICIT